MIALGNACSRRWYPQAPAKNEGGAPSSDASERPDASQDNPPSTLVQSATALFALVVRAYRAASTTPTLFSPLQAIYTRPSGVAAMFRTVPPPEGIAARANCS